MGITTMKGLPDAIFVIDSEKPPHHMGITTATCFVTANNIATLKNLPTTWGLRLRLTWEFSSLFTL